MTSLQLTHVHVHVESVKEDAQVWERDQEACYRAPYLRGNPQQVAEAIDEEVPCKDSRVDSDGQAKGNSRNSSGQDAVSMEFSASTCAMECVLT